MEPCRVNSRHRLTRSALPAVLGFSAFLAFRFCAELFGLLRTMVPRHLAVRRSIREPTAWIEVPKSAILLDGSRTAPTSRSSHLISRCNYPASISAVGVRRCSKRACSNHAETASKITVPSQCRRSRDHVVEAGNCAGTYSRSNSLSRRPQNNQHLTCPALRPLWSVAAIT